jgi:hypothetical protein
MESFAVREKLMNDFEYYAPNVLKIINEDGFLVPFVLNESQVLVHNLIERQLAEKGYVRVLVLKPRKLGISTQIEGRFYWKVSHRTGVGAMIMTEADQSRDSLFRMVKTYHENVPPSLRPATKASNEKALVFDTDSGRGLKSRYDVKTCDSKGGKGFTTHYNHWSECAYFSDSALDNLSGLLESIPSRHPAILGTEVIKETTANGASGHFYDQWTEMEAIIKDGGTPEYLPIFIPWTFEKGYRIQLSKTEAQHIKATLTDEEDWLLHFINPDGSPVVLENLAWRRWKIQGLIAPIGFTREDYFKQWYPITPDEAFIYSGKSLFGISDLKKAELECYSPDLKGYFNYYGKFIQRNDGDLEIWQKPRMGERYVIGADVAEGIQGEDRDYSSADVIRCNTGQQVAHVNCKLDPDMFGVFLNHLGRYYNNALLGVESNNHGLTTLTTLKHKGYPRIYQREMIDANARGRKQKKAGWLTTSKSKYKIIDQLVAIVRDGDTGIVNRDTIQEFKDYSILEDGSFGAKPGKHDDRVMSYAIAHEMLITLPRMRADKEKRAKESRGEAVLNLKEAVIANKT